MNFSRQKFDFLQSVQPCFAIWPQAAIPAWAFADFPRLIGATPQAEFAYCFGSILCILLAFAGSEWVQFTIGKFALCDFLRGPSGTIQTPFTDCPPSVQINRFIAVFGLNFKFHHSSSSSLYFFNHARTSSRSNRRYFPIL